MFSGDVMTFFYSTYAIDSINFYFISAIDFPEVGGRYILISWNLSVVLMLNGEIRPF